MTLGHSLSKDEIWPALPLAEWHETRTTLHMWTQIVGKVRLALSPRVNQWWEVPLYVCARGLTTSPIPCGTGIFEVNFDFVDHTLDIVTSWNEKKTIHSIHAHGRRILSRVHGRAAFARHHGENLANAC